MGFEVKLPSACSFIVGKARKTKHVHKNMEINGNTTNKHKLETA
jgi:hypothetical protein